MGELLASAAIYDNRTVGDADILAWMRAIGDLPYADADAAVAAHYGETTDRLMPAHVRTRVKSARRERLDRVVMPAPGAELTEEPGRYKAALSRLIDGIANGFSIRPAIAGPAREGPPPEVFTEAKATMPKPLTRQELAAQQAAESRREREAADRKEEADDAGPE